MRSHRLLANRFRAGRSGRLGVAVAGLLVLMAGCGEDTESPAAPGADLRPRLPRPKRCRSPR